MASKGKHVCITGISGFTGRHLAALLIDLGWQVSGIGPEKVEGISSHLDADITDRQALADWLARTRPTHIVHLAALSHVVGDPLSFYRVNLLGTEALIDAIAETLPDLSKLILASSANIYGQASRSPIDEDMPARPVNHYALSKVAMELVAAKWLHRLPIVIVRPFNYTGPGQSESFVFAKLAGAFRRRDAFLRLGSINVARDLSDVSDICGVYSRLLNATASGVTLNICSGRAVSLNDAIATLTELTDHHPRIEVDPNLVRPDEIKLLVGNPARLVETIGAVEPMPLHKMFSRMLAA